MATFLEPNETSLLTERYSEALTFVYNIHNRQIRKGNVREPYLAHLLATSSLVLEAGGNETEAIVALLHDSIEDIKIDPNKIMHRFGQDVLDIVLELTEDKSLPKPERKQKYVDSILTISYSAVRVSIADKLHNIKCYLVNPELFTEDTLNFYDDLIENYRKRLESKDRILRCQVDNIDLILEQFC